MSAPHPLKVARLKHLVVDLCSEDRNLTGAAAKRKIDAFLEAENLPLAYVRKFFSDAETTLGRFIDLPAIVQKEMANAAFHQSQEYYLLTTPLLHGFVFKNPLFLIGKRIVRRGWLLLKEGNDSNLLIRAGRFPMRALRYVARWLLWKLRFTRFYHGPPILVLWRYAGVDVAEFIDRYVESIPVDPAVGPVLAIASRKSEICALLGIDLLFSEGRAFFVEGNVNAGFNSDRLRTFPDGDPVCLNLLRYAKTEGYVEIRFNPSNMYGYLFPMELEESWRRLAHREGIHLRIDDDPVNGSPYRRPSDVLIDSDDPGILYVNGRYVEAPLGRMVARKGMMEELVRVAAEKSSSQQVFSPREILSDSDLSRLSKGGRFPNMIVKNIYEDRARGIRLYRAERIPPEARKPYLKIFEYVVPDRVVKAVEGRPREHVAVFRAYLLVTATGPVYLGVRKDISRIPLPKMLDEGPVSEPLAFIANASLNADSVQPTPEEDFACKRAVLQVGDAVHGFLLKKHGEHLRS